MVADPGAYRWSSYRAHALGEANAILSPHPLFLAMGDRPDERRAAYQTLFCTAIDEAPLGELRMALNQDQPLGNTRFYADIQAMTGQRRERRKRGRPKKAKPGIGTREDQLERPVDE